jgi:hypothetical protein
MRHEHIFTSHDLDFIRQNLHLTDAQLGKSNPMKRRTWTMANKRYIEQNPHIPDRQLAEHFGCTERAVYDFRIRQKITKADKVNIGFQKGNIPHNKGKKQADYMDMEALRRSIEARKRPEGTPYWNESAGIMQVDVKGRRRLSYAKYVYEQAHKVTLSKTAGMIHLDGNKRNCELSNLRPESYFERMSRIKAEKGIKPWDKCKQVQMVAANQPYQFYTPFKQSA